MIPKRHLNIQPKFGEKIMILQRKSIQKKRLKDSCRSKLETADIDVTNNAWPKRGSKIKI
jgi:hypothetical protein